MSRFVPAGWPDQVPPPGSPDWEIAAITYLLDCCPADFRAYPVLSRHPVVLARFAAQFVEGQYASAQDGLAGVRVSLADHVTSEVVESAADAWLEQAARLARTRRAVTLIEEALRGASFAPRL